MRTTLSDGRSVKLQFQHTFFKFPKIHERIVARDSDGYPKLVWIRAETECRLVTGPQESEVDVVPSAFARCASTDKYTKEQARTISLHRLLGFNAALPLHHPDQTLTLSREDTGKVLALYYGRKRGLTPRP